MCRRFDSCRGHQPSYKHYNKNEGMAFVMEKVVKIGIVIIIVGIAAYFGYKLFSSWHRQSLESAKQQERVEWEKRTRELMEKVTGLEEELTSIKGESIPEQKLKEVFGLQPSVATEEKASSFEELEQQIKAFFTYLDEQDYVQAYKLQGGTYQEFQQAVKKLSENLPNTTSETASLYNLYRNMAHFFRVLGKKRVKLIKDILQNESEIMESAMQTFYLWSTYETDNKVTSGQPSLKTMYEYSGFFLNTLAGRSYLLRRDSKIRMLTIYYSVLVLDKANDEQLNPGGLDIRPYIKSLLNDLRTQTGLIHNKQYISELEKLAGKYKLP
jgi:NADH:ubiquinone oxidoreductase subunit C